MTILFDALVELFDDLSKISGSLFVILLKKLIEIFNNFLLEFFIIPGRFAAILIKVLTNELFKASNLCFHNIDVIPGLALVHGCELIHLLFD